MTPKPHVPSHKWEGGAQATKWEMNWIIWSSLTQSNILMTTVLTCFIILQLFLFGNKQISRLCKNVMAKISNPPRHIKATTQHKTFHLTSLNMFSLKSVSQLGQKVYPCHKRAKCCFCQWRTKSILGQRTAKTIFEWAYSIFWLWRCQKHGNQLTS